MLKFNAHRYATKKKKKPTKKVPVPAWSHMPVYTVSW